jgi:hypothetical protein
MPPLANPRHEAFAFAIFQGLSGETRKARAQSIAYRIAYPNCAEGHSAEVAASRLLRRVEPIMARVRELQAESNARLQPEIDFSRERVGRRLHRASEIAEADRNASAMATANWVSLKFLAISTKQTRISQSHLQMLNQCEMSA